MPFYDYLCDGCGHRFEQNHGMSEPPVKVCPSCGAERVRKLFTTGGLIGASSGKSSAADFSPPPSCGMGGGGGGCAGGMCGM